MPYGIVLLPDPATSATLAALARTIGAAAGPLNLAGPKAPPHVSILHIDTEDRAPLDAWVRAHPGPLTVKIIGLLFADVPAGDYYVPTGGSYFGLEIVRRPDLDALHSSALDLPAGPPLGNVGPDFRPHITLGMVSGALHLPDLATVPAGELTLTPAVGRIGPFGSFPDLGV
ncbi:hypothetical protein [Winogradskya humida]|uniref:2'-5' RNA ligase n=1 Tax=Winogradskya humida TaxID=113566 RepID=A0ABQ3ZHP7_9ACTN|nr:hypothetical protein [Actinoplanes humidus]GIE18120.1 hypothetical protein Ahu01nite_012220 [Actinoplanes humidus]